MAERRGPLSPAVLGERPHGRSPGVPYSPLYADLYHSEAGAWAQAEEVFIAGSGLPGRWRGRSRFVILETGFGLGNNFLATWAAWRADPERCERLVFISVEKHPLTREDLARVHGMAQGVDPARTLATRLIRAWPPLTPGLHTLDFDEPALAKDGARAGVSLLLGLGDVKDLLPALVAAVDAFYLDGFSPDRNPDMWDAHWLSRLGRWAAPEATAATWSVARPLRDALTQAGFEVTRAPGFGSKRDRITAVYRPRFAPPPLAGGLWPAPAAARQHAIVIGAGLSGCAAAWALSREGWRVTVLDQHSAPAQEASGNPGGLFHGIVHGEDGIHARAHRAAALHTANLVAPWMEEGRLTGQCQGLLRLDAQTNDEQALALIERLALPADYLQWCPTERARGLSGLPVPCGGWFFMQGGWLDPANYARTLLAEAQRTGLVHWRAPARAHALRRDTASMDWQVFDQQGELLAQAPSVVLANAHEAMALIGALTSEPKPASLPLQAVRGQVTAVTAQPGGLALRLPRLPVAGNGYVLPLNDGRLFCGATADADDLDPQVRDTDHRHNLQQAWALGALPSWTPDGPMPASLNGRVGWRAVTPDRLPLIGALPLRTLPGTKPRDQPRLMPRLRDEHGGIYLLTGLGSRGITWSALAGRLLAHWVTGSPCPVESDLRDALDPARFEARQARTGRALAES